MLLSSSTSHHHHHQPTINHQASQRTRHREREAIWHQTHYTFIHQTELNLNKKNKDKTKKHVRSHSSSSLASPYHYSSYIFVLLHEIGSLFKIQRSRLIQSVAYIYLVGPSVVINILSIFVRWKRIWKSLITLTFGLSHSRVRFFNVHVYFSRATITSICL